MDDMANCTRPSELAEILKIRDAKITKKRSIAEQLKSYNQPYVTPQNAKKKSHIHDTRQFVKV